MLKRVLAVVVFLVLATTLSLRWSRTNQIPSSPLTIRRIAPADRVLRGTPQLPVRVELELVNTTDEPIELAPLKMSCSCQVIKGTDAVVPAHGTTTISLSLRYPPSMSTVISVPIHSPSGDELARTDIVLESDQKPPYFTHLPDNIDIQLIQGLSDGNWNSSANTVEFADQEPYVRGCVIASGKEWLSVSMEMADNIVPKRKEVQRTYPMKFQLQDQAWKDLENRETLQGMVVLRLSDDTERSIPWKITTKPPIVLFYDQNTRKVRGVRRGGAKGKVTLRCIPEGSGELTLSQFEFEQKIEAVVDIVKPLTAIVAEYDGQHDMIHITLEVP